jgi:hypothetical protein
MADGKVLKMPFLAVWLLELVSAGDILTVHAQGPVVGLQAADLQGSYSKGMLTVPCR